MLLAKLSLREVKDGPTSVLTAASADFDNGENAFDVALWIIFTTQLQDECMNIWSNSAKGRREKHRLSHRRSSYS